MLVRTIIYISMNTVPSKTEKDSFMYRCVKYFVVLCTVLYYCDRFVSNNTNETAVKQIRECMQSKTNVICSFSFLKYVEKCKIYRTNVLEMKYIV
jgi:hypothetical protein